MRSFSPHNVKRTTRTHRITRVVVIKERREGRPSSRERERAIWRGAQPKRERSKQTQREKVPLFLLERKLVRERESSHARTHIQKRLAVNGVRVTLRSSGHRRFALERRGRLDRFIVSGLAPGRLHQPREVCAPSSR